MIYFFNKFGVSGPMCGSGVHKMTCIFLHASLKCKKTTLTDWTASLKNCKKIFRIGPYFPYYDIETNIPNF